MGNSRPWKKAQRRRVPFVVLFDLGDGTHQDYDAVVEEIAEAVRDWTAKHPDEPYGKAESDPAVKRLRKQQRELNAKLADAEWHGEFQAMPAPQWDALLGDFPPRDGDAADEAAGFNRSEALPTIIRSAIVEDLSDEDWSEILDLLTEGDLTRLASEVIGLNRSSAGRPKLPSSSTPTRRR